MSSFENSARMAVYLRGPCSPRSHDGECVPIVLGEADPIILGIGLNKIEAYVAEPPAPYERLLFL